MLGGICPEKCQDSGFVLSIFFCRVDRASILAFRTRKCRSVSANLCDILSRFDTCGAVGQLTAGGTRD